MENNIASNYAHIKGWGIDADPKNEPTYPMKNYTGDDHKRSNWERPTMQSTDIELLRSIERPTPSAVFGEAPEPRGLSGMIRRYAFHFSENRLRHWFLLVAADRVDVMEGIVMDMIHGHVPNLLAERGIKSEWEHNRGGLARKVAVGAAVVGGLAALIYYMNRDDEDNKRGSRSSEDRKEPENAPRTSKARKTTRTAKSKK